MNNQDRTISRLYTEVYGNVHAGTEFKEKIRTITEAGIKTTKRVSFKAVCIIAAAVLLITAGGLVVSASRGVYDTVIINGVEKKARYGDFGNGTRIWGYEDGDTMYTVYVYGDFVSAILIEDWTDFRSKVADFVFNNKENFNDPLTTAPETSQAEEIDQYLESSTQTQDGYYQ